MSAASGIGRAVAERLSADGATVVGFDRQAGGPDGIAVIEGDVIRSAIHLPGKSDPRSAGKALVLGKLTIAGDLRESRVLAGYTGDGLPANADVRIGKVTVDGDFVATHTVGLEEWAAHVAEVDWEVVERATGLARAQVEELAAMVG